MRLWYLSQRRPAKAQASLRIRAVSPSLFAHMKYGSRGRVRPKIRHLVPLDGCACAFEEWVYGGRKFHDMAHFSNVKIITQRWHVHQCWISKTSAFLCRNLSSCPIDVSAKCYKSIKSVHRLYTVKFLNFGHLKICCNHPKSWTRWLFLRVIIMSNASKRCRGNCIQCRPWSNCSYRSSLIWVCTVCPDLSVRKLRIITVCFDGMVPCYKKTTQPKCTEASLQLLLQWLPLN